MLSFEELTEIVRTAVSLGVSKVRLTGGEPFAGAASWTCAAAINGVRELTMMKTAHGCRSTPQS